MYSCYLEAAVSFCQQIENVQTVRIFLKCPGSLGKIVPSTFSELVLLSPRNILDILSSKKNSPKISISCSVERLFIFSLLFLHSVELIWCEIKSVSFFVPVLVLASSSCHFSSSQSLNYSENRQPLASAGGKIQIKFSLAF